MKTKVSFDYETQTVSGKVNRNGAAQLEFYLLGGVGACIVNNTFDLADMSYLQGYAEKINENEEADTQYYLNISGGGKVLIVRKYINQSKPQ